MPNAAIRRLDYFLIALLGAVIVANGVIVELRSAYMHTRHTDLGPPLRAAWAVREGFDPYAVTDDGGLHYPYPILHAILMAPLADAPAGHPQPAWAVPYPVSVALWYAISILLLAWSVHHLGRVLEETGPDGARPPSPGTRQFWWTRCWPIWICMPAIGSTLWRGQVNILLLALLSGFIAAVVRRQRATAGWWLAWATCLKVIPGLLVLYPIVRRDYRMLAHYVLGLAAGLLLIPSVVMGPERAWAVNVTYLRAVLIPGLTSEPGPLDDELTNDNASDNQSIHAILHNLAHPDRVTRPEVASGATKAAHIFISIALIGWTFRAAARIPDERLRTFFLLGGLVILTVAVSPANHTHYMMLAVPVVLGLVHYELERRNDFGWGRALVAVVVLHIASGVYPRIPQLPGFQVTRDLGITMLGTLVVWYAGVTLPAAGRSARLTSRCATGTSSDGVPRRHPT